MKHNGVHGLITVVIFVCLTKAGVDVCVNQPCNNGGTCIALNSVNYTCQCVASYYGTNCQTGIFHYLIMPTPMYSLHTLKFAINIVSYNKIKAV